MDQHQTPAIGQAWDKNNIWYEEKHTRAEMPPVPCSQHACQTHICRKGDGPKLRALGDTSAEKLEKLTRPQMAD